MPQFIVIWLEHYGAISVFAIMALGIFGLPVPEETTLTFAGVLVQRGQLELVPTLLAAFAGSCCGVTISYGLGRVLGLKLIVKHSKWFHVTPEMLEKAHAWFERTGHWAVFFGYFFPGIRHLTALVAGGTGARYADFALFAYGGAVVWVMTFLTLGIVAGHKWEAVVAAVHQNLVIAAVVAVAVAALAGLWWWRSRRRG